MKIMFTVWMLLYPMISELGNYLTALKRKECKAETLSEDVIMTQARLEFIVYIWIAVLLWNHGV